MEEHLSGDRLEAYARRGLVPAELLAVDDHLSGCAECRARVPAGQAGAALASVRAAVAATEPDEHLRDEDLAAWVDGSADDVEREIAAAHLEHCSPCAADAQNLKLAQAEIRAGHEYTPSRRLTVVNASAPRWRALLQAAALVLVALGLWTFLRQPGGDPSRLDPSNPDIGPRAARIALLDGARRITFDAGGRVAGLDGLPPEVQTRVASALSSGHMATGDVTSLLGPRQQLMGPTAPATAFQLVSPVGTIIEAAMPTLQWQPLAGASSYRVTILDLDLTLVAESSDLKDTAWRVSPALERGRTYVWQVAARKGREEVVSPAPPQPDARFRVLDAARAETLATARGTQASHLALAVLYADAGIIAEAERELVVLRDANPDSPVPKALLASLARR